MDGYDPTDIGRSVQESAWMPAANGAAQWTVPLALSACRDIAPGLSLSYRSDAGRGTFGRGWDVNVPAFRLRTSRGAPAWDDADVVIAPDGQYLVRCETRKATHFRRHRLPCAWTVQRFRPRIDVRNELIECWSTPGETPFWIVHGADGSVSIYGKDAGARVSDPDDSTHVTEWLLQETVSRLGDHAVYDYLAEDGCDIGDNRDSRAARYPGRIRYGNAEGSHVPHAWKESRPDDSDWMFECVFDYGERSADPATPPDYTASTPWAPRRDPISDYAYGFECRQVRLCRQILMFHRFPELGDAPALVRQMLLEYDEQPWSSRLTGIHSMAYGEQGDVECAPPIDIAWSDVDPVHAIAVEITGVPAIDDGYRASLVDLYGDGVPGILHLDSDTWTYRAPQRAAGTTDGVDYAQAAPLPAQPCLRGNDAGITPRQGDVAVAQPPALPARRLFADVTGDGRPSWLVVEPAFGGYIALDDSGRWSTFRPFRSLPSEFRHESMRWADIAGEGRMDMLLIAPEGVRWWRRTGGGLSADTWEPHDVDRLPQPAPDNWVDFARLPGSSPALVEVDASARIRCWPSLGRGVFGRATSLGTLDVGGQFDPKRLFVADLSCNGLDDFLYATSTALLWFRNLSGHGFAASVACPWPPGLRYDRTWSVSFADVAARGCPSAVVTIPHGAGGLAARHWRMDFSACIPNVVIATNTNRGLDVQVTYRSSAQEWLDAAADTEPSSHLPFPIPVVSRVRRTDEIADHVTLTHFRWRDIRYDAGERHITDFGWQETVEEHDDPAIPAVAFRHWTYTGIPEIDAAGKSEKAKAIAPPLFTRWNGHADAPGEFDAHEQAELWRALAGRPRRTETLSAKGGRAGGTALLTEETRYLVRQVSGPGTNGMGIAQVWPVETWRHAYEDTPTDPRQERVVSVALDAFGVPARSIAIACARRDVAPPHDDPDENRHWTDSHDVTQETHHLVLTHRLVWHLAESESWLPDIPGEERRDAIFLSPDDLSEDDMSYEGFADKDWSGHDAMRLVSLTRRVYGADPAARPTFPALPVAVHLAGLDSGALDEWEGSVGKTRVSEWMRNGGWFPLAACTIGKGEALSAVECERHEWEDTGLFHRMRRRSPCASIDWSLLEYDASGLFVAAVHTPDGLTERAEYDYRHLVQRRRVDVNDNIEEVRCDAFGRPLASTIHGTEVDEAGTPVAVGFDSLAGWLVPADRSTDLALAEPERAVGRYADAVRHGGRAWMGRVPAREDPDRRLRWIANGLITFDGYIRARGRQADDRLAVVSRLPPHRVRLMHDRYPDDAHAAIQSSIDYFDAFGVVFAHAHRVQGSKGPWAVSSRIDRADGLALRIFEPHFADDWRLYQWPPLDTLPATCHTYDAQGRVATRRDPAGRIDRRTPHAWYSRADSPNAIAEHEGASCIGTPRFSAIRADGAIVRQWHYYRRTAQDEPVMHCSRNTSDAAGRDGKHYDARSSGSARPVRRTSAALGTPWTWSADAGSRWEFRGDNGTVIGTVNARGDITTQVFDTAGRPSHRYEWAASGTTRLAYRAVYAQPDPRRRNANIAGIPETTYGDGGENRISRISLSGGAQTLIRRLARDDGDIDWAGAGMPGAGTENQATFTHATYDALGRRLSLTDAAGHTRRWRFDIAGRLAWADVAIGGSAPMTVLRDAQYDAAGRRTVQHDGNDAVRTWQRDGRDGRLLASRVDLEGGAARRELRFEYDPDGNVTAIIEGAPPLGHGDAVRRDFAYDSVGQLIDATGEEASYAVHSPGLPVPLPLPATGSESLRRYRRRWHYDACGNVERMEHETEQGRMTHAMVIAPLSNRAVPASTGLKPGDVDGAFDSSGNPYRLEPQGYALAWDACDRLRRADAGGGLQAAYLYDQGGMQLRSRQWNHAGTGSMSETRFFEALECIEETAPGHGNERRDIVAIDTGEGAARVTYRPSNGSVEVRYELDEHPLSSAMILDGVGDIAMYEVFYPFGGTALQAMQSPDEASRRTIRYSGERREATDLYDYGKRRYQPWAWRWLNADPAGDIDGTNRYRMVRNNPLTFRDAGGLTPLPNPPRIPLPDIHRPPRGRVSSGRIRRPARRPQDGLARIPRFPAPGTVLPYDPIEIVLTARLPSALVHQARSIHVDHALIAMGSTHFTTSPLSARTDQLSNLPGGIGRFVIFQTELRRPDVKLAPLPMTEGTVEGFKMNRAFAVSLADTAGSTNSPRTRGFSLSPDHEFRAYFAPQGSSVTVPRHPAGDQPTYLLTPQFSGCSLVVHQMDRSTYRVFHVEGRMEDAQYNNIRAELGGWGAAALMTYGHYGYTPAPEFGAGARIRFPSEGAIETMHGFAMMRYRDGRWRVLYQALQGASVIKTPHLIESAAHVGDLRVVRMGSLPVSNPRQRTASTASDTGSTYSVAAHPATPSTISSRSTSNASSSRFTDSPGPSLPIGLRRSSRMHSPGGT